MTPPPQRVCNHDKPRRIVRIDTCPPDSTDTVAYYCLDCEAFGRQVEGGWWQWTKRQQVDRTEAKP